MDLKGEKPRAKRKVGREGEREGERKKKTSHGN